MSSSNQQSEKDEVEAALILLEKSNEEFKNHWVWKEMGATPEVFFEKVKKHVASLNIPKEQWDKMYSKTKEAHRIRALERRSLYRPMNLKLIGSIRA